MARYLTILSCHVQCDQWLESMTETYKCGAQYRHVLGVSMARLEVRSDVSDSLSTGHGTLESTRITGFCRVDRNSGESTWFSTT